MWRLIRFWMLRIMLILAANLITVGFLLAWSKNLLSTVPLLLVGFVVIFFTLEDDLALLAAIFYGFLIDVIASYPFGFFTVFLTLFGILLIFFRRLFSSRFPRILQLLIEAWMGVVGGSLMLQIIFKELFDTSFLARNGLISISALLSILTGGILSSFLLVLVSIIKKRIELWLEPYVEI